MGLDGDGWYWLVVHTGSRHLGKQVADYYQNAAHKNLNNKAKERKKLIETLREQGRHQEIEEKLKEIESYNVPKQLAYVQEELFDDYLHDMQLVQEYAELRCV